MPIKRRDMCLMCNSTIYCRFKL